MRTDSLPAPADADTAWLDAYDPAVVRRHDARALIRIAAVLALYALCCLTVGRSAAWPAAPRLGQVAFVLAQGLPLLALAQAMRLRRWGLRIAGTLLLATVSAGAVVTTLLAIADGR